MGSRFKWPLIFTACLLENCDSVESKNIRFRGGQSEALLSEASSSSKSDESSCVTSNRQHETTGKAKVTKSKTNKDPGLDKSNLSAKAPGKSASALIFLDTSTTVAGNYRCICSFRKYEAVTPY